MREAQGEGKRREGWLRGLGPVSCVHCPQLPPGPEPSCPPRGREKRC